MVPDRSAAKLARRVYTAGSVRSPQGTRLQGSQSKLDAPSPGDGWSLMRSSPEAKRPVLRSDMASGFSLARSVLPCFLFCVIWFVVVPTRARGQSESPQAPAPPTASQPESKQNTEDLPSPDEPPPSQVNANISSRRALS